MKCLPTLALVSLLPGTALAQSTWFVDVTGVPPGTGSSASPYTSIQYAIEQPSTLSGDTLLVRPGSYIETIDYLGKVLTVQSTNGPEVTVVTATPPPATPAPAVSMGPSTGIFPSVLEGFTITGGQPADGRGGAVYCVGTRARVTNCVVIANDSFESAVWIDDSVAFLEDCAFIANTGTAVRYVNDSAGDVIDCRFEDNVQDASATAGLWIDDSSVDVIGCEFVENESNVGSALFAENDSLVDVRASRFTSNRGASALYIDGGALCLDETEFTDNVADFSGGGACYMRECDADVDQCTFVRNRAGSDDYQGGAIWGQNVVLLVTRSTFMENTAARGGAAHISGGADFQQCWFEGNRAVQQNCCFGGGGGAISSGVLGVTFADRCVFLRNRAEGAIGGSGPSDGFGGAVLGVMQLSRCTLVDNSAQDGGGAAWGTPAALTACIVLGNTPDQVGDSSTGNTVTYSDIEGGFPGIGNIDLPPLFLDAQNDNFRLAPGSPCIDTGDPMGDVDLDGSRGDMGAFSFVDCNDNRIVDSTDISVGTSLDRNGNGFPDECECLVTPYCETAPHSAGDGARMGFGGSTSVSQNDLVLLATDCPPNRPGLFFYGTNRGSVPFGDGLRCVLGATFRLGLVQSSQQGTAAHAFDNTTPPRPAGLVSSGSRWYFQFFFRDPGGPGGNGNNLTDALDVIFCP